MHAFPFTKEEWAEVEQAALNVVNATTSEDEILHASQLSELQAVLASLRERYGDHPILLETEADFTEETQNAVTLYERAIETAVVHGLPTLSIRISLASVMLQQPDKQCVARQALLACRDELTSEVDETVHAEWSRLLVECDRPIDHNN